MTQEEYIRRKRYHQKRRATILATRAAVGVGVVVLVVLVFCGCIYVKDTFWGEESVMNNNILVTDAEQTIGQVQELQAAINGSLASKDNQSSLISQIKDQNEKEQSEAAKDKESEVPTVVVDAGHGGKDGGTFSGKIIEKDITLAVAQKMKGLLEEEGVNVIMTRDTDVFLKLEERAKISNENDTDLFISVHCNYYEGSSDVKGIECYCAKNDEISKKVAEVIVKNIDKISGLRNRGAKMEDHFVTKNSDAPAVLVEMGFLSNPTECKNLSTDSYQQSIAEELVQGVMKSLEMLEKSDK